eukprot:NODE_10597_length_237_cov_6.622340_g9856_i0.p1 GENE.NODE_10597_length_237_cov_6.622340_g9856_i0~~NODE_10597_length_237_cov_6.622340_g9856_i0.p1  ORF type:complete len:58 (+),score=9.41 NODE_10597_length_237_cov_6.622340_g9856_i0:29-202(+)
MKSKIEDLKKKKKKNIMHEHTLPTLMQCTEPKKKKHICMHTGSQACACAASCHHIVI